MAVMSRTWHGCNNDYPAKMSSFRESGESFVMGSRVRFGVAKGARSSRGEAWGKFVDPRLMDESNHGRESERDGLWRMVREKDGEYIHLHSPGLPAFDLPWHAEVCRQEARAAVPVATSSRHRHCVRSPPSDNTYSLSNCRHVPHLQRRARIGAGHFVSCTITHPKSRSPQSQQDTTRSHPYHATRKPQQIRSTT